MYIRMCVCVCACVCSVKVGFGVGVAVAEIRTDTHCVLYLVYWSVLHCVFIVVQVTKKATTTRI